MNSNTIIRLTLYFIILMGTALIIAAFNSYLTQGADSHYKNVTGKIKLVESKYEPANNRVQWNVNYEYTVDGKPYGGMHIYYDAPGAAEPKYTYNRPVKIYFNPENPEISSLTKGEPFYISELFGNVVSGLVLIGIALYGIRNSHKYQQ